MAFPVSKKVALIAVLLNDLSVVFHLNQMLFHLKYFLQLRQMKTSANLCFFGTYTKNLQTGVNRKKILDQARKVLYLVRQIYSTLLFHRGNETFLQLCSKLWPYIKSRTRLSTGELERQVAVTLYYLPDEGCLHKTANSFDLSRSSVSIVIQRVMRAIGVHLGQKYISVPLTEDEVTKKVTKFFSAFRIP